MSTTGSAPLAAIVEADDGVVALLELLLRAEGFRTVRATAEEIEAGPARILAFLEEHRPQVVLYDIALPYDGSWQAFVTVCAAASEWGQRFVLLTTHARWLAERAGAVGSPDVIEKPFDVNVLVAAVRRARAGSERTRIE